MALLCALCGGAKPRSNKDWSKMGEDDWKGIEKEWETEEERKEYEFKPPSNKGVNMADFQKPGADMQKLAQMSKVNSGPTMMFADVEYPDCCNKKKTEEISSQWTQMLTASGLPAKLYVIEDGQVLFQFDHGYHAHEVHDFIVTQPNCASVTWNDITTDGAAMTDEIRARKAKEKSEREAEREAKRIEEERVKKYEEKQKRKRKRARKAAKAAKDEV